MMIKHTRIFFAAFLSLLLAGCSGFTLIEQQPAPSLFNLKSPSGGIDGESVDWQLIVEEPDSVRALGTNRITLMRRGNEIQYYKGARWTDRGPRLLQARIIEVLEDSGRILSVGRETSGINADYRLKTELRDFHAHYSGAGAPTIVVTVSAKLLEAKSRRIVAAEVFSVREVSDSSKLEAIVLAFNLAAGKVTLKVSDWALEAGGTE
jgi:cholesterol transport system auxiliary component